MNASGTLYLTQTACRQALALQVLHDAWLPVVPDEMDAFEDELEEELGEDEEPADPPESTSFSLGC